MELNGTELGWYAQARNSAGVGSTGLAKPWNVDSCTLTGQPSAFARDGTDHQRTLAAAAKRNPPSGTAVVPDGSNSATVVRARPKG
ncbi:hypothetical protein GCM10027614_47330 [Micromonospora vulcania]